MAKKVAQVPARAPSPALSASSSVSSSSSGSSSSSSSSAGSSSPEPEAPPAAPRPPTNTARTSKYAPPRGMKAVSGTSNPAAVQFKDFAGNSQLELWAVRVPDGVKPSALDGLVLNLPSGSKHATGAVGRFTPKKSSTEYEIFLADEEQPEVGQKRKRAEEGEDHGGDEMKSLVPLLPDRTRGDKHYAAPKPLTRHLTITRALPPSIASLVPSSSRPSSLIASQPSPVPGAILSATELLQPEIVAAKKIKREQPEGLRMRILLPGMRGVGGQGSFADGAKAPAPVVKMDVDEEEVMLSRSPKKEKKEKKDKKDKKDKEGRKSKKVKADPDSE